jgi:hypothetical protein
MQFNGILFLQKILNKILGVIGVFSFKSQAIFQYLNANEGQFLFLKSCSSLFFMEKNSHIKDIA